MNGVRELHGRKTTVFGAWALAFLLAACGGSNPVGPDPAVAPFVGDWNATAMVLSSVANPDIHPDLIGEFGASFTINVQPSGQYTAILIFSGQSSTQIGQVTVSGGTITLHPEVPPDEPEATSTYVFTDADHLVLDGDTEFDFNFDGTAEAATAHIELERK